MKKGSTARLVTITLLLLTCTASLTSASMFELEIVPVLKIMEDPTIYDSTMAYRKISVVGDLTEIDKRSALISEGGQSLKVDVTKAELFSGFSPGDQAMVTGEFRYDPIGDDIMYPSYVLHYPVQDIGETNISTVNTDTAFNNGKYLTVRGEITCMDYSMGRYTITITENSTQEQMKVFYYGATELKTGEAVKVSGLYNGGVLHSEDLAKDRGALSISTLVPGFSFLAGLIAAGGMAILLSQRQR
ncbi:MAG: hypothetical protein JW705_10125 [Methanosarcinaceae archaeon]|nr:hypothetical protein [Methanosarcinaceae archaeon]